MTNPKAAISWSGGKDCCLAALRAWDDVDIVAMVTMFNEDGGRSRSHGLRPALVAARTKSNAGEPWRYALERIALEGIDASTWVPSQGVFAARTSA